MFQIAFILDTGDITGYRNDPELSKSTVMSIFQAFVQDALRVQNLKDIWKQLALIVSIYHKSDLFRNFYGVFG